MEVVTAVAALRRLLADVERPLGFVPTMGALHAGHLSLVRRARQESATVVVSIFVNRLQFGPDEDFERYPRDVPGDLHMLDEAGTALVFTPEAATFTPLDSLTTVHVAGLSERLEGAARVGHFDGVATIVNKLLNVVRPDAAYFGEKDFQQLAVIRAMVRDLELDVRIAGCPTVREPDGLALSSRNAYLSPTEREDALALYRALQDAREHWDGDADSARRRLRRTLEGASGVRLDYAEVADPETLESLEGVVAGPAQALVAAWVGGTRLIDNIRLEPAEAPSPSPVA